MSSRGEHSIVRRFNTTTNTRLVPANLTGNDLSGYWNPAIRLLVSTYAGITLATIERDGWEGAFGKLPEKSAASRVQGLRAAATAVVAPSRPWWGSPTR